jgi:integrase/recombinase XerD
VHYPYGRGINPKTGKRENRKERIILGPCSYEEAKLYEQGRIRQTKKIKPIHADPRLCDVYVDFLANYRLRVSASTTNHFETVWEHDLLPFFGSKHFSQITQQLITQFKTHMITRTVECNASRKVKPATVNKLLNYLSVMIKYSKDEGFCNDIGFKIERFPSNKTQPPPKTLPTSTQIDEVIKLLPDDNRGALIKLMYFGGLRIGDARGITYEQVDLYNGFLIVVGKGEKHRIVPITPELRELLEPRMKLSLKNPQRLLFANPKTKKPYTSLKKSLTTLCKKAGISSHVTHHVLRHCFGTHMLMQGANLRSVQLLMGHSSSKTTEMYTKLIPTFLTKEIMRLSRVKPEAQSKPEVNDEAA